MASSHVIRVTMFKIPKKEDRDELTKYYEALSKAQSKDGAPYILSLEAGPTEEDARSQGFNFLAKSVFKSREDFEFYDKECKAHNELKAKAKSLDVQGMLMLYYTPAVAAGPNL